MHFKSFNIISCPMFYKFKTPISLFVDLIKTQKRSLIWFNKEFYSSALPSTFLFGFTLQEKKRTVQTFWLWYRFALLNLLLYIYTFKSVEIWFFGKLHCREMIFRLLAPAEIFVYCSMCWFLNQFLRVAIHIIISEISLNKIFFFQSLTRNINAARIIGVHIEKEIYLHRQKCTDINITMNKKKGFQQAARETQTFQFWPS